MRVLDQPHLNLRRMAAIVKAAEWPQLGQNFGDPPNVQAMHQAVAKAMADHPELMADPHWAAARAYVGSP